MKSTVFHHTVLLSEQDLLAPDPSCPFCTSTERTPLFVLQEEPKVVLLGCHVCHAASASRMPRTKALEKYYSHYYDNKEEKITSDIPSQIAMHIFRYAIPYMGDLTGRDVFLLDYGGGDGSISIRVAHKLLGQGSGKVNIALVDYDLSTIEVSGQRIQITRPGDLAQISDNSMDLVIASAIVEHIPEPRDVLIKLFASLKPGGIIYARTPYVRSLSRLANMVNLRFDFTYPAHVHDLGARFWNNIVDILPLQGGFRVLRSAPSIVETSFQQHFFRTLAAHILKIPGYVFRERYGLVGGWEVFIRRNS